MSQFAQGGDFCPNTVCADYGKRQGEHQQNIIRFGKTKASRQRYKCKTAVIPLMSHHILQRGLVHHHASIMVCPI